MNLDETPRIQSVDVLFDDSPLNDENYQPEVVPLDGRPPAVVAKWGPRSQYRWFARFQGQIKPMPSSEWARFYPDSIEHRGLCCTSCLDDYAGGYDTPDDHCCCEALRARDEG